MGDGLTSCLIANNKLTLIRHLFRANVVDLQTMGDGMTKWICLIGVQKVDKMFCKNNDNSTINHLYYSDSRYKNHWTSWQLLFRHLAPDRVFPSSGRFHLGLGLFR